MTEQPLEEELAGPETIPDRPQTKAAAQVLHGSLHRGRAGRTMPRGKGKHSSRITVPEEEVIGIEDELEDVSSLPLSQFALGQPSATSATSAASLKESTPTPTLTDEEMIPRSRHPSADDEPLETKSVLKILKEMFGISQ